MKKILILLIGFAFTQSIQTKEFEVIFDTSSESFNLFDSINAIEGSYMIQLMAVDWLGQFDDFCDEYINTPFFGLPLFLYSNHNYGTGSQETYNIFSGFSEGNSTNFSNIQLSCYGIPVEDYTTFLVSDFKPNIYIDYLSELADYPEITNFKIKFWATGMFEDGGVGLQGDMNDDEIINVVDIVALVNIIIGE